MKGRPVTAVLAMLFVLAVSAAAFAADPKYTKSSVFGPKITDGVTDEFLQMVRDDPDIKKGKPLRHGGAVTDDDLKKVASLADVLTGLFLERTDQVSDLSPLSNLSGLTYLKLDSLKDQNPRSPRGPCEAEGAGESGSGVSRPRIPGRHERPGVPGLLHAAQNY
ncbi:hypothetical protein MASR2M17_07380 [Aminivibrio sp.]